MNNGYPAAIGVGAKRQDVRFADIDGECPVRVYDMPLTFNR